MGIGGSATTSAALQIPGYHTRTLNAMYYNSSGTNSTSNISRALSIYAYQHIACKELQVFSDRRIKTNIVDVPDNLALQQVRDIPCRYYEYIDKVNNGDGKTIGFIAQEVKEHLPMAVDTGSEFIPNEYRALKNITWTDGDVDLSGNITSYKLHTDLTDVSGINYKFMVGSDLSDNQIETEIVGNADNTFTFDASYQYVFCYGKQVDDFHSIDKNQIFALHHSAIQEIDRLQFEEKEKTTALETKVTELETKNAELQTQLNNIMTILNNNNLS